MPGHIEFDFITGGGNASPRRGDDPFSLVILADLGGQATPAELAEVRPQRVDVDTIDALWERFTPRLDLEVGGHAVAFAPRDLDDFHPDNLYRDLPLFRDLRRLRARLRDPEESAEALAQVMGAAPVEDLASEPQTHDSVAGEAGEETMRRLLGDRPAGSATDAEKKAEDALDSLLRRVVSPHVVPQTDPRVDHALESIDRAIAASMRQLLHDPGFQALEAAWLGLNDLVRGVETDETLAIRVASVGKAALVGGLPASAADMADSALYRLIAERAGGGDERPSVIAVMMAFGPGADDVALLGALGALADHHGAALLGGASAELVGCDDLAARPDAREWAPDDERLALWRQLRRSPLAPRIGLALPRLLARLPYGAETHPVDAFEFEEMPERVHEHYLWAQPAWGLCRLLAGNFAHSGWAMEPDQARELIELPAHHFSEDGEARLQPCAEVLLSERSAQAALAAGVMPFLSYRNQDKARLARWQSIAEPATALKGPWNR